MPSVNFGFAGALPFAITPIAAVACIVILGYSILIIASILSLVDDRGQQLNDDLTAALGQRLAERTAELSAARRECASVLAALSASEANLRQILEHAAEGIWTLDRDGRTVVVNEAMASMMGCTVADMMGRSLESLLKDQPDLATALTTLDRLRTEGTVRVEGRLRRANGEELWVRASSTALRDAQGAWSGAMAIVSDITAERRAHEELRLQTAALNASADAIVITAPDGAILWVNPAFTELTGYEAAEAVGRNPRDLVRSGTHTGEFYASLWNTVLGGKVWRGEIWNRRKDGTQYLEDMTITPVRNGSGCIVSFIAIKRDLTEKKRLEAEFLQAQKMESVGRLAGGIAHDFNNLLTVINGFSGFSIEGLPESDPRRRDLLEVQRAGERAAALTRQLLAFSRKQVIHPEITDLNLLLAGAKRMLERVIGEDIRLVVDPSATAQFIKADLGQLEQVVMNLVVNARDAMPAGGTLTLTTREVRLDHEQATVNGQLSAGSYSVLEVRDTGTGMSAETQAQIFEPFFTTKDRDRGTGLGLSTVHGIMSQSGGGIGLLSVPGEGTTFTLWFPRLDTVPDIPVADDLQLSRGSERILIVEDDDAVRDTALRMLEACGYEVACAANGPDAIRLILNGDPLPGLVLTDAVMPGLSGAQLVKWVSHHRPQVKTLLMSGHIENAELLRSINETATACVPKPFSAPTLSRMVRKALDGRREKSSA